MNTPIQTRGGTFWLQVTKKGLYQLHFPKKFDQQFKKHEDVASAAQRKLAAEVSRLLQNYFKGSRVSFRHLKIDWSGYSPFEVKVLKALSRVNYGQTLSYGKLAGRSKTPRAARAVGSVMRKNRLPIILPCHRIIRSDGKIGNYSSGIHWKKTLLQMEARH